MEIAHAMLEKANAEASIATMLEKLGVTTGLKIEDINIKSMNFIMGQGPRIKVEIDMRLI